MAHANNFLAKGYGSTRQWLPPFTLLDDTGASMFSVDSSGNVIAAGTVTGTGTVDSGGNASFTTLAVSGTTTLSGNLLCNALLDLSNIAAGSNNMKLTATNATPAVTWTSSSGTAINSTAPAGYMQISVGGSARYIPFWA